MTPARRTALQTFEGRELMPTRLNAEELSTQLSREVRERAFFMAKVLDVEVLQKFHDEAEAVIRGDYDETTAEKNISLWLESRGYQAPAGKEGTIEDLSTLERINVVLRTNIDMARGYSAWLQQMQVRRFYPAQRLVRKASRMEPRDWNSRWREAYNATNETPGAHPTEHVALLDHPIWPQLSRFMNPYPPYDYGSGMGVDPEDADTAKRLGLMPEKKPAPPPPLPSPQPPAVPAGPLPSFNETMESSPAITLPAYRSTIADQLGNLARWEGDKLVMTDPNGTRPTTAASLRKLWDAPAPKGFEAMPQRSAIEGWKGGRAPVTPAEEFHLLRLFGRIETEAPPPPVLHGWLPIDKADVAFLAGLALGALVAIPAFMPGMEFGEEPEEIETEGWAVSIEVSPSRRAIDVRDLRPGKPGFVYVGGTAFRVERVERNEARKTVHLTVTEHEP